MISLYPELHTSRLWLVPCANEHLDGLHAINSDPEVMRYIGPPETRAQTQAVIERIKQRWQQWGYSWWTLIERLSGEIIGIGCVQNLRRAGSDPDPACPLEIGWRLRRDRWRQGLATESAVAMAEFAFGHLHAEALLAVCDPENAASRGVMEKLGMHYRGLENWYARPLATYEATRDDWLAARASRTG